MKMINELSQAKNDSTVGASAARSRGLAITFHYVPQDGRMGLHYSACSEQAHSLRSVKVCEA